MRRFVAVWPSDEVGAALAGLPRPGVSGLRWTRHDQWHVTLRFLGESDPEAAAVALADLAAQPAVAELGPVTRLLGQRIVVVPVDGLDELARTVVATTVGLGGPPADRPFTGHLTLARAKGPVPSGTVGIPITGRFPVGEVCLVRSRTLPEGAAYETLERFSLG